MGVAPQRTDSMPFSSPRFSPKFGLPKSSYAISMVFEPLCAKSDSPNSARLLEFDAAATSLPFTKTFLASSANVEITIFDSPLGEN